MMHDMCSYCMTRSLRNGVCTQCGKTPAIPQAADIALPPGTILTDEKRFMIGEKLGHGGFGITYVGMDMETEDRVAIKEFMPKHIVNDRNGTILVVPPDRQSEYEKFLRSFHKEAHTIHLLKRHPAIVEVNYLLETNNTAYLVMEMLQGMDLNKFLRSVGKLSTKQAFELLTPIINALIFTHGNGVLHRDISPDNIYICLDRSDLKKPRLSDVKALKLIDFGAAHVAVADFTHSFPGVRKSGYSPLEQNWDAVHQGTWTDVYAFAATFYYTITLEVPPAASDRSGDTDSLKSPSRIGANISPEAEQVLLKGMAVGRKNRYQTMDAFCSDLKAAFPSSSKKYPVAEPKKAGDNDKPSDPIRPQSFPVQKETNKKAKLKLIHRRIGAYWIDWLLLQGSMIWALQLPGVVLGWLLMVVINTGLEFVGAHASVGKMLMKIRLRNNSRATDAPTLVQCLLHNICCATLPFIGMETLLMLVTKTSQLMHEQLLKTDVCLMNETAEAESAPFIQPSIRISCEEGSAVGKEYCYQQDIKIGRDDTINDLVISADGSISKQHCQIFQKRGVFYLKDENSKNGTWLNGIKIDKIPQKLKNGDAIKIGQELFRIRIDI